MVAPLDETAQGRTSVWLPACGHLYWANDSHRHVCPFDGPSGGLRSTARWLRHSRHFLVCWGQSSTSHRRWAPHGVSVRGGATPPSAGSRAPTPGRCRPLPASLPLALAAVPEVAGRVRERDTDGTTSSFADVPPHAPRAVPNHLRFREQDRACSAFALGRPSGRLTRGERRPLRSKTSTQA